MLPLRTRLLYGTSRIGSEALGRSQGLWLLYYYAPPSDAHLPTLIPSLAPMWNHTVPYVASSMSFVLTVI